MGRKTQYNHITSPEKLAEVNEANMQLKDDFLAYLKSIQRSDGTIAGYSNDLDITFIYLLERCNNKKFIDVKKREWLGLQSWLIDEHGNSPARVKRIKAAISSLSNYIENVLIMDDEPGFENFRSTIKSIESPVNTPVREKTILTDEECQKILDALIADKKYEQACCFALARYSGRRKQELFRFKVSFFDDANLIYGCLYKSPSKILTKGRSRGKMLTTYCLKDFKPYLDLWLEERVRRGMPESDWVFPDANHPESARDYHVADSWAQTISRIIGKNFYWHSLRHRWATALAEAGIPDDVIEALQGWAKGSNMVAVYKDIDAIDDLEKYFTPDGIKGGQSKSLSDL